MSGRKSIEEHGGHRDMPKENNSTSEDRFARQDQRPYSDWTSTFIIAAIVIVLCAVVLVYYLK
jgi:hypothetical protein